MWFILLILVGLIGGDVLWWLWADRRLRRLPRPTPWRLALAIFCAFQLLYLFWFILFPEHSRRAHLWMPATALAGVYLWHLFILPITVVVILASGGFAGIKMLWRRLAPRPQRANEEMDEAALSRRQVLSAAVVAVPPLLLGGTVGFSLWRLNEFRIRNITIPLATLPPELDGLTIAHVSDVHVGRFTRPRDLPAIVEATNKLKADLVVLTGDLIDLSLADLPAAVDFVRQLDPRRGLFIVEGNHDLIDDPLAFEVRMRTARLPLLLDESAQVYVNGRVMQILGATWQRGDVAITESISRLDRQREREMFPILLAHHPHAFDAAADAGIPLTLAGHTHGGQLMLNERLGAGPVMFRYVSGLYQRTSASLVVSNGVGNWFPLRTHAPAEILHLTLRRA